MQERRRQHVAGLDAQAGRADACRGSVPEYGVVDGAPRRIDDGALDRLTLVGARPHVLYA